MKKAITLIMFILLSTIAFSLPLYTNLADYGAYGNIDYLFNETYTDADGTTILNHAPDFKLNQVGLNYTDRSNGANYEIHDDLLYHNIEAESYFYLEGIQFNLSSLNASDKYMVVHYQSYEDNDIINVPRVLISFGHDGTPAYGAQEGYTIAGLDFGKGAGLRMALGNGTSAGGPKYVVVGNNPPLNKWVTNIVQFNWNQNLEILNITASAYQTDNNSQWVTADKEIHLNVTNFTQNNMSLIFYSNREQKYDNFTVFLTENTDYFAITAQDALNSTSLTSFSAIVDGTPYTTTTGTITTALENAPATKNIYVWANGYVNRSYLTQSLAADLASELYPYSNINASVQFQNYRNYSNINYTKNLTYTIEYSCHQSSTSKLVRYITGSPNKETSLTCNNNTQLFNDTYSANINGYYNISFLFNSTLGDNFYFRNYTFLNDISRPTIVLNISLNNTGFVNSTLNTTAYCYDNLAPLLTYNLTFNKTELAFGNFTNNTYISNVTVGNDGYNGLTLQCSDFFNRRNLTYTQVLYNKILQLIDEKTNSLFDVRNITSAAVYFDDNSTYYDFWDENSTQINFTSFGNEKLRFVFGYEDGTLITRYIDVSLVPNDLRVCANKEHTTHYEQLIISASEKQAVLKNIYSNCYVVADYTRFAYQDSYVLKAYTIDALYYLYTYINSIQTFLASLDGSIATYINLDVLEFSKTAYEIDIITDALSVVKTSTGLIEIFYLNVAKDNTDASLSIVNMDNNQNVFSYSEFEDFNNFTIYFDYTTLSNISNSTVFRIDLTATTTDGTSNTVKYFDIGGNSGFMNSKVAMTMAIILTLIGFTLTISRLSFSWFGVLFNFSSIAVLTFAVTTWYGKWFMAINIILIIYTFIVISKQNYPTLA